MSVEVANLKTMNHEEGHVVTLKYCKACDRDTRWQVQDGLLVCLDCIYRHHFYETERD